MIMDDDVTNGELHRRMVILEQDVRGMSSTLTEIKASLAGQGVKVGVVWAGLGVAGSALLISLLGLVLRT
jgi:hypothetical protein